MPGEANERLQMIYVHLMGEIEVKLISPRYPHLSLTTQQVITSHNLCFRISAPIPKYPVTGDSMTINCSIDVSLDMARQVVTVTISGPATETDANNVENRTSLTTVTSSHRTSSGMRTITG